LPTVAILAFPGVQALDVTGPMDVFSEANHYLAPPDQYRLTVLGTEAGAVPCSNGMLLQPHARYEDVDEAPDLLLVPGGPAVPRQPRQEHVCTWLRGPAVPRQPRQEHVCTWLRRMGERCARVASVCNGAFLLAHAGLLDGRRATTHWNDVQNLASRFPLVSVQPDRIFVRDGHIYTSAGVTAGIDLALHLVYEDWGPDLSLNVAKRLVVFAQRSGGQSQFSPYLAPHVAGNSAMQDVRLYVLGHLDQDLSVDHLARVAAMSERNFARVFAKETRMTPADFVERARVDAARVLLESSAEPLKTIAHRCGFGTSARMRSAFVKNLGVTALQYRRHFGAYAGDPGQPETARTGTQRAA
jgi:transcriptional regulator GlxA family with amidase domain